MAFENFGDLNDIHLDVLREIGNIGSGNAASALSSMLDQRIDIQVPKISILDYSAVVDSLGGPENLLVGLEFTMHGDAEGMIMFLLQKEFAHLLVNALVGSDLNDFAEVGEMELSVLKEVGNIMASSYINAMASLTNMKIEVSVPDISIDMAGAVLSAPAIHYANIGDKIIYIDDEFAAQDQCVSSQVLMVPDMESLAKIMENLGISL